jgi:hypothetical protein
MHELSNLHRTFFKFLNFLSSAIVPGCDDALTAGSGAAKT